MKLKEKKLAIKLRQKGWSINNIKKELKVSKSSVSLWVRNIELTKVQKKELNRRGFSKEAIEKRRESRLKNENEKRQIIINKAKKDIRKLSKKDLFLIGIALYWAEGSKTDRGIVQFSNSDPEMIMIMMNFFRKICNVPEDKFRGYIHIHSHLQSKKAENYWSEITKIPLKQFYKTYCKKSKASKNKRDSLPYGTLDIYICNTIFLLKIKGWIEKISELKNMAA